MLLNISGRSRKRQLALAEKFGITEYSTPGGGCLLTEAGFCRKMRELKEREGWTPGYLRLLSLGRHFRLPSGSRVVSGRDERENNLLEKAAGKHDCLLQTVDSPGSLVLLKCGPNPDENDIITAAAIAARYSKEKNRTTLQVSCRIRGKPGEDREMTAAPLPSEKLELLRI
jgi:hypothetical protein